MLQKYMREGMYKEIYDELDANMKFTLNDLMSLFPGTQSHEVYLFMMYAISKEETPERHLAICDNLMFMDPYISGSYSLIRWHLERALEVCPGNIETIQWIVDSFSNNPDSPFGEEELLRFQSLLG